MSKNENKLNASKIKETFSNLFEDVNNLISEMKLKSSEEILNGSISEAQKLLGEIVPYQNFYEKLKVAKNAFDKIESKSEENEENVEATIEENSEEEVTEEETAEEVENFEDDDKISIYTPQESFRIPILKALIYLGGSSEEEEIIEFVKKDMKNKLSQSDFDVPEGEDQERWKSSLYFETANMIDEGLLSNESTNKKWEIAQKGIDYLGKFAK